ATEQRRRDNQADNRVREAELALDRVNGPVNDRGVVAEEEPTKGGSDRYGDDRPAGWWRLDPPVCLGHTPSSTRPYGRIRLFRKRPYDEWWVACARRGAVVGLFVVLVEAGQPRREALDRYLKLRVLVEEVAQPFGEPLQRHGLGAAPLGQLFNPAICEVHASASFPDSRSPARGPDQAVAIAGFGAAWVWCRGVVDTSPCHPGSLTRFSVHDSLAQPTPMCGQRGPGHHTATTRAGDAGYRERRLLGTRATADAASPRR